MNRLTNAVCVLTNLPGFVPVRYQIAYAYDAVGNATKPARGEFTIVAKRLWQ